jgi:hypothetical protein
MSVSWTRSSACWAIPRILENVHSVSIRGRKVMQCIASVCFFRCILKIENRNSLIRAGGQACGGFGKQIQALYLNSTRRRLSLPLLSSFFWPATPPIRGSTARIIPYTVSQSYIQVCKTEYNVFVCKYIGFVCTQCHF